jgi:hypothetical protein
MCGSEDGGKGSDLKYLHQAEREFNDHENVGGFSTD